MTPKESEPDLLISVQESPHELVVACCRVGALSVAVPAWDLLKKVTIIFIISTIVWPNNREGTQPHPSTKKLD